MAKRKAGRGSRKRRSATQGIGLEKAAVHPGVENLKPAKPGEVRNPTGRNGSAWLKEFRQYFEDLVDERDVPPGMMRPLPGERRIDLVKRSLFLKAIRGGDAAQKLVVEQMQGRARQHVELTGKDGAPLGAAVRLYLPGNGRDVTPPKATPDPTTPPPPAEDPEGDPA